MAVPLLAILDFTATAPSNGLSVQTLSHISSVYIKVTPSNLSSALTYVPSNFSKYTFIADVTSLSTDTDAIKSLLNAGAAKAISSITQIHALKAAGVTDDRLIFALRPQDGDRMTREQFEEEIADTTLGLGIIDAKAINFITGWLREYGVDQRPPVYVSFAKQPTKEQVKALGEVNATLIIPSELLSVDPNETVEGKIQVADILFEALKSDRPDGLITTLVVDEQSVALGLVYSSKESLAESLRTGTGVYMSRKRGLWYKGATSGATQELVRVDMDCDSDCLRFVVRQHGKGFCHMETTSCFGASRGITALQRTLQSRLTDSPEGSYTKRLFDDEKLLKSKIMEEAEELCDAKTKEELAFEAADLIYFALVRCIKDGVSLTDIEANLDAKSLKVVRRQGDAKPQWTEANGVPEDSKAVKQADPAIPPRETVKLDGRIEMRRYDTTNMTDPQLEGILQRPSQRSTDTIMSIVQPIIAAVRADGDKALLSYTQKFERCPTLKSTILSAPFPTELMQLTPKVKAAIDLSYNNIYTFHAAQKESAPLSVETMPGVKCSRFARPIERVGLYIPGGTAVLPSTALMLGVPALVAGCKTIVLASPPRSDGSITPEIVYIAHKVGASAIVLAGGAQAVAALAYGTESVPKVDKILGPGNQFVTAAKMVVSNDTSAGVSIDMPAGPSEVLVIADVTANPAFVASDLLSQAEHGVDSQVVCITVGLNPQQQQAIEDELHKQAMALPRVDIVRGAIEHSVTLCVDTMERAFELSNLYAPEHLILQIENAKGWVDQVTNAGSVFIGEWTPESVGDYSAGVNHSLPTYGYAKQYSGVNLATFVKHITSSELTAVGLRGLGNAVIDLAEVEGLHAHGNAVRMRLDYMDKHGL